MSANMYITQTKTVWKKGIETTEILYRTTEDDYSEDSSLLEWGNLGRDQKASTHCCVTGRQISRDLSRAVSHCRQYGHYCSDVIPIIEQLGDIRQRIAKAKHQISEEQSLPFSERNHKLIERKRRDIERLRPMIEPLEHQIESLYVWRV